ncbi:MAG: OmpA family protein [Janthinobacterium lividum]
MRRAATLLTATLGAAAVSGCSLLGSTAPTYNVFFGDNSARIDDAARTTIVEAARVANAHPSQAVTLDGYADLKDKAATGARAQALARQRVDAVSEALASVGVNTTRILRAPYVPDPQADAGVASRRVEIDVGR